MLRLHSCEVAKMTGPKKKKVVSNFEIGIVVVLNLALSLARVWCIKIQLLLELFLILVFEQLSCGVGAHQLLICGKCRKMITRQGMFWRLESPVKRTKKKVKNDFAGPKNGLFSSPKAQVWRGVLGPQKKKIVKIRNIEKSLVRSVSYDSASNNVCYKVRKRNEESKSQRKKYLGRGGAQKNRGRRPPAFFMPHKLPLVFFL